MNQVKRRFQGAVTLLFGIVFGRILCQDARPVSAHGDREEDGRNSFLVLSLIIPVAAGMGLTFGIVLGLAGQIALIPSTLGIGQDGGSPHGSAGNTLAVLFGFLAGMLLNKARRR